MRLKKQKRHRRTVRFYTACFGFRGPFKVLCDGTFVHHLLVNRITPADTALSNILGAPVKMFTTRCVLAELKSLGDSYLASHEAACNLIIARCDHERRKSAVACIMEIIGENNPEHFFVASQDVSLRNKFQEIPGVPLIFGLRTALLLEPPSAFQHQFIKSAEEERSHMTDLEYKLLNMKKKKLATEESGDASDANKGVGDQILGHQVNMGIIARKRANVLDKAQFKKKRAKGPNPLSCKRKKICENSNSVLEKEMKSSNGTVRNRSRKRKRSRKGEKLVDATD